MTIGFELIQEIYPLSVCLFIDKDFLRIGIDNLCNFSRIAAQRLKLEIEIKYKDFSLYTKVYTKGFLNINMEFLVE